jgi:hypothetical protein
MRNAVMGSTGSGAQQNDRFAYVDLQRDTF